MALVHCQEEVVNKRWLWFCNGCMSTLMISTIIPNLDYSILLALFDDVGFVDCYEYWARYYDFKMRMSPNRRLAKTLVGLHSFELLALPFCVHLKLYLQVPD